jgi:hypothetical protein
MCLGGKKKIARFWLYNHGRWKPEVVNMFGAAASYRRATAGRSHDDAHPDNSTLHKGKFALFRCTSAELFFSCCDSVAAAATTWAPRPSTCEKQRAAPRASA